jgi:catechol 2,3-dioxygenase-like lactoylglutathione lyase family enzyme
MPGCRRPARGDLTDGNHINMTRTAAIVGAKIHVGDLDRARDFYVDVLGLRDVESSSTSIPGVQAAVNYSGAIADAFLCLVQSADGPPDPKHAAKTTVIVRVVDVRAAIARAEATGVETDPEAIIGLAVEGKVIENNGMLFAFLLDVDGYVLEIFEAPVWPPVEG